MDIQRVYNFYFSFKAINIFLIFSFSSYLLARLWPQMRCWFSSVININLLQFSKKCVFKKCIHKNTPFRKLHLVFYSWKSIEFSVWFFTDSIYIVWMLSSQTICIPNNFFSLERFIDEFSIWITASSSGKLNLCDIYLRLLSFDCLQTKKTICW